jgi:hypothetical protein
MSDLYENGSFIYVFTKAHSFICSIQLVTTNLIFFRSTFILPSRLWLESPGGLFARDFQTSLERTFVICNMRAKYAAYLILLALIIHIRLGDYYRLWTSPLYNFIQPPLISSILDPNILLRIAFSSTSLSVPPLRPMWETRFHTHTKLQILL